MKRTRVSILFLVLAMLLALVSVVPAMAQDDPLVIWADGERAPLLQELGEQFEADFGVPVEVTEIGLGDARDDLLNFGPAGEGPDILIIPHDSIGLLVANGAIVPIDLSGFEEDFTEAGLDLFTYQEELWGVPYAIENIALIRNVDLVPEAPQTWGEVRELSQALQESGAAEYALSIQTGNTYHNFPVLSAFGGYIFGRNEDGTFNINDIGVDSEGGFDSAEWLSGMYSDGLMPSDVDDDVAFELFTAGDTAMIVTGPWFSQRIIDTGINYSIDPFPGAEGVTEQGAPFSGGQGFAISAFSDNRLLAETFLLDFVATQEFMQILFDGIENEEGESSGGRPPTFIGVDTSSDPNIEAFNAAGSNAVPMPAIPEMGSVWSSFDNALTLVSQGADPIPTYENATEQISIAIEAAATGDVFAVTIAGSFQAELGCEEAWRPQCEITQLEDQGDGIWTGTFTIPAGEWEYKAAMNEDWAEAYPEENVALSLSEETEVTFTFDNNEKTITDSVNAG